MRLKPLLVWFPGLLLLIVDQVISLSLGLRSIEDDSSIVLPSDSCDWTASGLTDSPDDKSVVPIYLRCLEGNVKWRYPRSGLHVVLSRSDSEFRGCIRISRNVTSKVRIFVEGISQLRTLYDPSRDDNSHPDQLRCFVSNHQRIALYLESIDHNENLSFKKPQFFEFNYHLEPVASPKVLHDDMDICRPCSDEELTALYCSSDFILSGYIQSLRNDEQLKRTELSVRITDMKKDSLPSLLRNGSYDTHQPKKQSQVVVLHRPLKCHSKAGLGSEFLFLGRWILGNPVIKCAPKLSHWKHAKHRSIQSGSNQCKLE